MILFFSCQDNDFFLRSGPPTVTTESAIKNADEEVILQGFLKMNNTEIEALGFEYGEAGDTSRNVVYVKNSPDKGNFKYVISSGLSSDITYFYRAFIVTDSSIYGETKNFSFTGYTPKVDSLSSNTGQVGDTLRIYGKRLREKTFPTDIRFGNHSVYMIPASNDSILQCFISHNLPIDDSTAVTVTINQNVSNAHSFILSTPSIHRFEPISGFDGDEITVFGENFSNNIGYNEIFINDKQVERLTSSKEHITFKLPYMKFHGKLPIKLSIGKQVILSEELLEIKGPVIKSYSANEGYSGDTISIVMENIQEDNTFEVLFGDYTADIIEHKNDSLKVIIPSVSRSSLLYNYFSPIKVIVNGLKETSSSTSFKIKQQWHSKAATPFSWGHPYTAFTYNNLGYILETNDKVFYRYNPSVDTWQREEVVFPGERGKHSLLVVKSNKLLKIGGLVRGEPSHNFWEYNFDTNSWTQKENLPFSFTRATHFEYNGLLYILTNQGEVWTYNYSSEEFTQKNNLPITFYDFAFAFKDNQNIYLITYGSNWLYDPNMDSWQENSQNTIRQYDYLQAPVGVYAENTAYILDQGQHLLRFDTPSESWVKVSTYPGCGGSNAYKTTFTIDDKIYWGATSGGYGGCTPLMFSYQLP
ncbi:hypothetical protein GCM10023331_27270 [Algivirga pacifica]|uniref:IPT/TIG domain-containing protein n=2 Tax=Algivirga pacifica TaxID=1162670 RepID=A0ABP9DK95_9BACT